MWAQLGELRNYGGEKRTVGLADEVLKRFEGDPSLQRAVGEAHAQHAALRESFDALLSGDEADAITTVQEDYINFYKAETVNPYVAIAARGPWIVTSHGAVLHDSGGYGMLGQGHAPDGVLAAMAQPTVMANVMTPSFSQKRLGAALRKEIGQTRGSCPFDRFICMNSGSESVTVASRISDVNARRMTAPGARHAGKEVKFLALKGAFHGRTDRPAQVSDSSMPNYRKHLASFMERDNLIIVEPNNVEALRAAFAQADADGVFIESMFMEPVMGEGNPGVAATRPFYDEARRLTNEMGSLLLVDSIQAGIRGTGYLSIVDYPGFEDAEAPDLETYSKALNAGQFPLSVLACNERAAGLYERGIYGNTMTTNPRALEVAVHVLESLTPELRENIRARGDELVAGLKELGKEFEGAITSVQGTGLLLCAELEPSSLPVVGFDGVETWCRRHGLGVIHGGKNALRFTPHFAITSEEVEIILEVVRQALRARLDLASPESIPVALEAN